MAGLPIAAALGATGGNPDAGLEVLLYSITTKLSLRLRHWLLKESDGWRENAM